MYARRVGQRELTFAVSGMLWQQSLVMIDIQTHSLWSHLLGRCMRGELEGEQLQPIPSIMTDWKTWRQRYPRSTVLMLPRTTSNYRREFYRHLNRFVVGLAEGDAARAWPFDRLELQPVVNDQFAGKPVLVVFDRASRSAYIYDRRANGKTLVFIRRDGRLVDQATQSQWDEATGRATSGKLQGTQLQPLPAIPSYRRAWEAFHPRSQYWTGD